MVKRHISRWWMGAGSLGLLAGLAFAVGAAEPEDELRSATVLSFLRHTEWLKGAQEGPITVGVIGRPSMVQSLRRTLEGKTANNHTVHIVDARVAAELSSCQVIYVATDNNNEARKALAGVRASRALTIGEAGRFLEYGGAVSLMIVDGHMSFEVSLEALDHAGVNISSKLLRYGQVKARPPE
jgi:hypothetical protein